jgi:hypothetical protein
MVSGGFSSDPNSFKSIQESLAQQQLTPAGFRSFNMAEQIIKPLTGLDSSFMLITTNFCKVCMVRSSYEIIPRLFAKQTVAYFCRFCLERATYTIENYRYSDCGT